MLPSIMLWAYLALCPLLCLAGLGPIRKPKNLLAARSSDCVNGPESRGCWNNGLTIDDDMDEKFPDTGTTVHYDLDISVVQLAPDGVLRDMMVVNGQYPGPTIRANWGDRLVINVKNSLKTNGTGIHWHGLRMLNTNDMDGVVGVTECPIAPGESRTYSFLASQYGTSWYHSHYSVQYADGVAGPIVINGPTTANYDVDLGPLQITDWFHQPIFALNAVTLHAFGPPTGDSILINGTMASEGGVSYGITTLEPGKKHLLRLTNVGINNFFHVSLDNHPFTVVAADFVPVVPFSTNSLVIGIGQRYDVIIEANQTAGNYWFRVGTGGGQCDGPNKVTEARSIFSYADAESRTPNSTGIALPTGCYDEPTTPWVKTKVPSGVPSQLDLTFSQTAATGNLVQWLINDSALAVSWDKPTLQHVLDGEYQSSNYKPFNNIYTIGTAHSWQYWIIQNALDAPPVPHPIHLHGHDFYVLEQGSGVYDGSSASWKLDNPIRRDSATLPGAGYLVLAFESDNPGAWLMHCHIPFHVSAGFGLQFLERAAEIQGAVGDFNEFKRTCRNWLHFQEKGNITSGDSGLRVGNETWSGVKLK